MARRLDELREGRPGGCVEIRHGWWHRLEIEPVVQLSERQFDRLEGADLNPPETREELHDPRGGEQPVRDESIQARRFPQS